MSDSGGIVVFSCKKCDETFEAPVEKAGNLFSCPTCSKIAKIPGIALQKQATKEQMIEIHEITNKIKITSILLLVGICILCSLIIIKENLIIAIAGISITLGCLCCLGHYAVVAKRHLSGGNSAKMMSLGYHSALGLLVLIIAIPIFIRIIVNEKRLLEAGFRGN
jgi:hypothetical protein